MSFLPRGSSPVRRPSESLSGFSSGMETPTVTSDTEHRPPLSADTDSSLAGITFETSHGQFVCLYWQSTTGAIWQSKFLLIERPFTWRLYSIVCVASDTAKPHTPLTAVSWANGLKRWVFFLDESNLVRERISTDWGKTWCNGTLNDLTIATGPDSKLSANLVSHLQDNITYHVSLWYHDANYEIRQLRFMHEPLDMIDGAEIFRGRWTPGPRSRKFSLRNSFLTSGVDYRRWPSCELVYYLLPEKKIGFSIWPYNFAHAGYVYSVAQHTLGGTVNSSTTMCVCHSPLGRPSDKLYINTGTQTTVIRHKLGTGWEGPFPLHGSEPVRTNFIALEWDTDDDTIVNLFWLEAGVEAGIRTYDVIRGISPAPMSLSFTEGSS